MISVKRIIFWEPSVSPHKLNLISSLAFQHPELDVFCCAQIDVSEKRLNEGWKPVRSKYCKVIISPPESKIMELVSYELESSIHIFSGIRYIPMICVAIRHVINRNGMYYIMSEPRSFEGIKGYIRFIQSWLTEHTLRKNTLGVFSIGFNGKSWFQRVGYAAEKVFDFAYYLEHKEENLCSTVGPVKRRLLFIGKLTKVKGVKYLINAVNTLGDSFSLKVIGVGEQREKLESLSLPHITFEGSVPMTEISKILSESDILILPSVSDVDGWGAVVSEALLQGVAVVVTNKVGASLIVVNDCIGKVIPSKDSIAIKNAVLNIISEGYLDNDSRSYRKNFAINNLTGVYGAKYLWDIIQFTLNGIPRKHPFIDIENLI